ncbi:unnamed protein product, partial [Trypanosoma congolense IL3000]
MMKFLLFLVVAILGMANATEDQEKNHNGPQHSALCGVLGSAVKKLEEVRTREPTDPLRKALATTIFGNGAEEKIETLKTGTPAVYRDVEIRDADRGFWCGEPRDEDGESGQMQPRWSGHSSPHDMVCLCTMGEKGWPLNGSSGAQEKLCGKTADKLGGSGDGWSSSGSHQGGKQIQATWETVIVPCLNGEEGGDLKQALNEFLGNLQHK